MTALRPEREGAAHGAQGAVPYGSYESRGPYDAHGGSGAFAAPGERPGDPPTAPLPAVAPDGATSHTLGLSSLPGRPPDPSPRRRHRRPSAEEYASDGPADPAAADPAATMPLGAVPPPTGRRRRRPGVTGPGEAGEAPEPPTGRRRARVAPSEPGRADETAVLPPVARPAPAAPPRRGDETVALRAMPRSAPPGGPTPPGGRSVPPGGDETMALRRVRSGLTPPGPMPPHRAAPVAPASGRPVPTGGRAARRKAAQEAARRGGRRAAARGGAGGPRTDATAAPGAAPRTRMEAKRAARARKDSPGVVMSRVAGELFITLGVVMLLFVTYQLWWTNIRAHQQANGAANSLRAKWDENGGDRDPGTFSPGEGFAIIYIPKLDVKAPIAEGIDKHKVLDRGMVGHYAKGGLKTAMPWDKKGNFALAGHRNTHGEPFRYINHLKRGDEIIIETQRRYYTYEMDAILPQTAPSNTGVIGPVPTGSGFTKPGRYITLTTCTPEFTSTYRMIVWGKMVDERPRSDGKPDALVE
ncbi:class E sortase [Streptomyces cucumeris]|uniref:class E sortase n=1 Tax=Streptomyces cucumeris TaxID=2962890 RepID=UPI003D74915B